MCGTRLEASRNRIFGKPLAPPENRTILKLKTKKNGFCDLKDFLTTVVVVYIDTMKTTFDLNFEFSQAFKQHGYWILDIAYIYI